MASLRGVIRFATLARQSLAFSLWRFDAAAVE
jgi:hypothetical protein